jgi:CRP-like cAMP-binding protein
LKIEYGVGQNRLLTGLSPSSRKSVLRSCESMELLFADVLYQPGDRIEHVYFPVQGFVSVVALLDDGGELGVGLVGSEGMIGASLVLGIDVCADLAIVQREGTALRMPAGDFRKHCGQKKDLRCEIQRYLHVCVTQLAQVAACTGYHLVQARLARWLLMSRDRARSNEFHLTQEFLAYMLGVRRVGVTQAAAALQAKGLIRYRRGDITILNSAGLKEASCACYGRGNQIYGATMNQDVKRPKALRTRKNSVPYARF